MVDDFDAKFSETVNEVGDLICSLTGVERMWSSIDEILRPLYLETAAAYAAYRMGE